MFKMIYNIARTELQMLFYSPVAWLILVVFGVQSGMLFADQLAGLVSSQEMGYDIPGSTISIFASRWGGSFHHDAELPVFLYSSVDHEFGK